MKHWSRSRTRETWDLFKSVTKNFLGNSKQENLLRDLLHELLNSKTALTYIIPQNPLLAFPFEFLS
jgi:hypothetical protein